MEAAPLVKAHAFSRAASDVSAKPIQDVLDQHKAAAAKYSEAAIEIEDSEALRILKLLEEHHHQLACIVQSQSTKPGIDQDREHDLEEVSKTTLTTSGVSSKEVSNIKSQPSRSSVARASLKHGNRELSSTIATNLASARGIPRQRQARTRLQSPVTDPNSTSTSRRPSSPPRSERISTPSAPPIAPSLGSTSQHIAAKSKNTSENAEQQEMSTQGPDGLTRFYSAFGGLMNKLSAPLAFAGLPLNPNDEMSDSTSTRPKSSLATSSETIDVTKLFSKAAIRAIKDDHGSLGAMQESFMFVPTGGGSVSYAGILNQTQRKMQTQDDHDDIGDDFVDARETPQPASPRQVKKGYINNSRSTTKTVEELELENASLKQLTDNLSRRLYMWEKSAQSQTSALQQSMKLMHPRPRSIPDESEDKNAGASVKIEELEGQVKELRRDMEKQGRENERLKGVVIRYRERWEKLKEGAKTRREGTGRDEDVVQEVDRL